MLEYVTKRLGFLQMSKSRGKHEATAERKAALEEAAANRLAETEAFRRELEEAFGTIEPEAAEIGESPVQESAAAAESDFRAGLCFYNANQFSEALEALGRAAEQGHTEAQYLCGQICRQDTNSKSALSWYRRAAKQGHLEAQLACAVMYEKGEGTKIDLKRALSWYEQAAKLGSVEAQLKCGRMYYAGRAETRSPKKARRWLEIAAGNGSAEAEKLLAECF